jgi:putative endonuclease
MKRILRWLRGALERLGSARRSTALERLGARGERAAVAYLRGLGYRVVATNVRVRVGRSPSGRAVVGEIDAIAYDGETLVFVEVKTRRREGRFAVERAVGPRKRHLLVRAARRYRRLLGVAGAPYRFDVVTVLAPRDGALRVRHLRAYFSPRPRVFENRPDRVP